MLNQQLSQLAAQQLSRPVAQQLIQLEAQQLIQLEAQQLSQPTAQQFRTIMLKCRITMDALKVVILETSAGPLLKEFRWMQGANL
jgi:hypothetical protein